MDLKIKNRILTAIHALYLETEKSGTLPDANDPVFAERIFKILDLASGFRDEPQEKDVTILLSDLRGFTALSEIYSPLEIIDLLNRYFAAMTEVINQYGGTIDKFMGDSIMVIFGSPESFDDDLQRTLSCAIEMQIRLRVINDENRVLGYPPLYMGIGINTGRVVAGKLGSELYSEYTVIGDHVNLASRVESYSLRGQILISEHTYALARDYVTVGQVNTLLVKGKEQPVNMYELLAVSRPKTLQVPVREDRKSPRIEVHMPLSFQLVEGKIISERSYEGAIIDLSYGGMYISCETPFVPFTEIKFPLSLSLSANKQSDVYAKIIRVNPVLNTYHYHLEFSGIASDAEQAVRSYINRIIEHR